MVDGEGMIARAPFVDAHAVSGSGRGVIACDRDGLGLATVIVRHRQLEALAHRIRERYGIELPRGNVRKEARGVAFAGLGPETWLATSEKGGNEFSASLREEIGALASISDQSDGYAVLRLTGGKVRDTLAKLIPLDVHPRAFKPGDVASTVASHIGITLWRLDDAVDATPAFEIAVFRSLAGSFWHALAQSAAEFGLSVNR
jgi:methylglutamate dehydrogenase subunit D